MKYLILALCFSTLPAHAVKNMNAVINGKLYISGSSGGRTSLSSADLHELCEQGFTYAVYVYAGGRNQTITCGGGRQLKYVNSTSWKNPDSILKAAMASDGKALIHCWNGVHASRYAGAVALNKHCGFTGEESAQWWRSGFAAGSLPAGTIAQLMGSLSRLPAGRGGLQGCPTPR